MMVIYVPVKFEFDWKTIFQNKGTITVRQAFLSIYILCKSDEVS